MNSSKKKTVSQPVYDYYMNIDMNRLSVELMDELYWPDMSAEGASSSCAHVDIPPLYSTNTGLLLYSCSEMFNTASSGHSEVSVTTFSRKCSWGLKTSGPTSRPRCGLGPSASLRICSVVHTNRKKQCLFPVHGVFCQNGYSKYCRILTSPS